MSYKERMLMQHLINASGGMKNNIYDHRSKILQGIDWVDKNLLFISDATRTEERDGKLCT